MAKYAFNNGLVEYTLTGGADAIDFGEMNIAQDIVIWMRNKAGVDTANPVTVIFYKDAAKLQVKSQFVLKTGEIIQMTDQLVRAITLTGTAAEKLQVELDGD